MERTIKNAPVEEDQRALPLDSERRACITNIDRTKCHRTVPMRVLGLGASRTGTCSLRQALIDLGYNDTYHFTSVSVENPSDAAIWIRALLAKFEHRGPEFTRREWDQLLGHCQAVTDTPAMIFYAELIAAYPDAKVVLTLRDSPRQWWQSQMATIVPWFATFIAPPTLWGKVWLWFATENGAMRLGRYILRYDPMYQTLLYDFVHDTETGIEWYEKYVEYIRTVVPKEKLLILNVKEGWGPLCEFLGEDVPGYAFPRKNDTGAFVKGRDTVTETVSGVVRQRMTMAAGAVAIALLAIAIVASRSG